MVAGLLLRRALWLPAAGAGLAATATRYYLTHPQRIVVDLPADLAARAEHVHLPASDGARLHAIWLPAAAHADRTIVHLHGYNGSAGLLVSRVPPVRRGVIKLPSDGAQERLAGRLPDSQPERVADGRAAVAGRRSAVGTFGADGRASAPSRTPFGHAQEMLRRTQAASSRFRSGLEPLCAWPVVRAGLARGYNFLLTDIRCHGLSGGTWDTTGRLAASDAMGWAKWLREEHGQLWAGLWGHSFGASVGLALAVKASGGGFDAMALDSPAVSAEGIYSGLVRKPVYWAVQPVLYQLSNRKLLDELAIARVWMPILLIHGAADRHVPAWQSQRAYDLIRDPAAPDRTALWLAPGADHLEALGLVEQAYIAQTLDWFDRWFG